MTTGRLLGKFMPPHLGHVYLGEFASRYVDRLSIVVGTLAREPIPGPLRYAWMRELFPAANVIYLTEDLPQAPDEHPDFWTIWRAALQRVLPERPDFVFASDDYGARLAEEMGARFVPVDKSRLIVPISGTAIRADPMANWDYLARCVRPYFAKRVCVFGPESTGKSTLTRRLADHFRTTFVPEYARTLLEFQCGAVTASDMEPIARGQAASEEALARSARRVLLCDTDALTTVIWSEALFGSAPEYVRALAANRTYDLTLLCDVDVPWVADPVRYRPADRDQFFSRCRAAFEEHRRPYVVIRGDWESRFRSAVAAVEGVIGLSAQTRT